jgi:PAS domain S-box-containing protein
MPPRNASTVPSPHAGPANAPIQETAPRPTVAELTAENAILRDRLVELEARLAAASGSGPAGAEVDRTGALLRKTGDGAVLLDREGRILDVDDAYCRMCGYSRDALLTMTMSDLDASGAPEEIRRRIRQIVETGDGRFDVRHLRNNGEPIDLEASVAFFPAHGGRLSCVLRDITARTRAERTAERRRCQFEAVRAIGEEISRELDLTRLLDLAVQRAAGLVRATGGAAYLWAEAEQALVPQAWSRQREWLGRHRVALGQGLPGVVAARREGQIVNDYRTWQDASPLVLERSRIVAAIAEPLFCRERLVGVLVLDSEEEGRHFSEDDREALALLATQAAIAIENARLFAELTSAYESVRRAQDELVRSEKLRALGQMAAGMAHDLNNILAAILGQTELLRLRAADLPVQEALNTLEVTATDAAEVVRRLQDFARQQPSRPLGPVDLAAVVREALEITRPRWRDDPHQRGMTIRTHIALDGLPPVLGYAPELREALTNLILNAVDAMPHGGTLSLTARVVLPAAGPAVDATDPHRAPATPSASSAADGSAGLLELTVSDTGLGMSEEVRRRVFDPFFTTKGVKGTGLGLSVVYGIVQRHGGRIDVASGPGAGTAFSLYLKIATGEATASPSSAGFRVRPRRVLVIDDDATVRRTTADLLQEVGHSVVVAASGSEGLTVLSRERMDLVITDLGMPGMTGWDVARALRAVKPRPPVVLLTGWGERPASQSEHAGLADRILGKPVRLHDLLAAIDDLAPPRDTGADSGAAGPASS